jgi:hypothetical protein
LTCLGKVFWLYQLDQHGIKINLEDRESVEGIEYFALKLSFPARFVTHLDVNPKTFLVERRCYNTALHPDLNSESRWLETRFSDFKKVDDVV